MRHLRCFVAVAEELHVARAAERLHIEQSLLSRAIKGLEYDLDVQLFERTTRSTRSTWAGQVFLDEAHRVLTTLEQAMASTKAAVEVKRRQRAINPMSKANQRRAQNKRVLISMVEIDPEMGGAKRVIVAMCRSENAEDVMVLAKRYIAPGTTIFSDENPAYNQLDTCFQHFVVNHSEEYSTPDGVSDNMAESFFSRMRRGQYGVHHGSRPQNMELYGWEFAWRETHRRRTQRSKVEQLGRWLLLPGYSRRWRGYHGGHRRRHRRNPRPEIVMGLVMAPSRDARSMARKGSAEES